MIVGTLDLKTVALKHDHLWLKQAKDMTLFQITYKELSYINRTNPEQGLRMLIVLKRKIMTEIMTTFFPSVLLTFSGVFCFTSSGVASFSASFAPSRSDISLTYF